MVGYFRVPWGFRVWRGKDTPSPAQWAIRVIDSLPKSLAEAFRVRVLANTVFGSIEWLKAMKKRRYPLILGVSCDRNLSDGRKVRQLAEKGQLVKLDGVPFPVTISWFYLKRDGKLEKRFGLSRGGLSHGGGGADGALKDFSKPANIAVD